MPFLIFITAGGLFLAVNTALLISISAETRQLNETVGQALGQIQQIQGQSQNNLQQSNEEQKQEENAAGTQEYQTSHGNTGQAVELDYVSLCGLDKVDKPVKRTAREVLKRLEELSKGSELIKEIWENSSKYPEKLLEALANNPEMADFVAGYLTAEPQFPIKLTEAEKEQEYPLLLQWDPRWGYLEYGDGSNIGLAGCGPTCLAMALYYLLGDESLTPDKIAEYSMENDYYVSGTGTAWALLSDFPSLYGVNVEQPRISEKAIKQTLDGGGVVICSVGPGDFTVGGHFLVIYGYEDEGFLINDPNCVARSRETWTWSRIESQIKNLWTLF